MGLRHCLDVFSFPNRMKPMSTIFISSVSLDFKILSVIIFLVCFSLAHPCGLLDPLRTNVGRLMKFNTLKITEIRKYIFYYTKESRRARNQEPLSYAYNKTTLVLLFIFNSRIDILIFLVYPFVSHKSGYKSITLAQIIQTHFGKSICRQQKTSYNTYWFFSKSTYAYLLNTNDVVCVCVKSSIGIFNQIHLIFNFVFPSSKFVVAENVCAWTL